jgi:RNA polymerase sigma-70 factor, ECF subfamily
MVAEISPSCPALSSQPCAVRARASQDRARVDAALVGRCNAGDDAAFGEIIDRYRARTHAIALSVLRNHADAEEIVQDTFIHAYRGLPQFRGDCSLAAWLRLIALNLARNRYWYFIRRHRHAACSFDAALGGASQMEVGDLLACGAPDPARSATNREFLDLVAHCMEKLGGAQREILELRSVREKSYEEIGEVLRLNPGTVKSRIARARRSLRTLVEDAYAERDRRTATSLEWFHPSRPSGILAPATS